MRLLGVFLKGNRFEVKFFWWLSYLDGRLEGVE